MKRISSARKTVQATNEIASGRLVSGGCPVFVQIVPIDRKSTRLNSSHLVISYAVFCLNKKENTPSVKSTKRLSLLSGGEKSMTAIAFLFAVFLPRPCPLYILDLLEAALDNVKLDRFLT